MFHHFPCYIGSYRQFSDPCLCCFKGDVHVHADPLAQLQGNEADLAKVLARVTKTGQILVVDYYAPWCRACQKLLRYMLPG